MAEAKGTRVFSGIQPSGSQVHLGNYLGAMRRFVDLAEQMPTIFCIVNLHALNSVMDAKALSEYTHSLACAYLAVGIDPKKTILFRQGDVPEVCELSWYLCTRFSLGLLERAHSLKDARAKDKAVSAGVMYYPILMAADILLYKATHVPVGADQKQHLEMTREIAVKYNYHYGNLFPIPEPLIAEDSGVIPGLDGRKMSKSYDNYIGLFEDSKALRKKVMKIVTDSKGVSEKKDPDTCNVFRLFKHFASKAEQEELRSQYEAGGMGYGHAKQQLFEAIERTVAPMRDRYQDWMKRVDDVSDILRVGAESARKISVETIQEVRSSIGVGERL